MSYRDDEPGQPRDPARDEARGAAHGGARGMRAGQRNGLRALGAAVLALLGFGASAQSQPVTAAQAPHTWVVYAQRVSQQLQSELEGQSPEAQRFHAFFDQRAASAGEVAQVPAILSVKVWLDAAGGIVRAEFPSLGDEQANADLRNVLLKQNAGAPPRGMRQPVVVRLQFAAASAAKAEPD